MKRSAMLGSAAALCAAAALLLREGYQEAFGRKGSPLMRHLHSYTHRADYYIRLREYREAMQRRPRTRYELKSDRGETLVGYCYPCGERPAGRLAFLLHGYRGTHDEAAGVLCQSYLDRGFDVFACDHVASGESEGRFLSFDYYESQDCLKWLDFLLETLGQDTAVVLHGFSMGAATAMKMSDRLPQHVKFIVEDSGFSTAVPILRDGVGAAYPLIRLLNRLIAGFDVQDTDVCPHLRRSRVPILFVHGSEDPTVPYAMGEELYALYPGEKDCLFIPGGLHVEAAYRNLPQYCEKLDAFIEKYI